MKTTVVGKSLGVQLRNGLLCHYLDVEGAADYSWMLKNGTDANQYLGKRGVPKTLWYVPDFPSGDASFRYMSRTCDDSIALGAGDLPCTANVFFHDCLHACIPESMLDNDEKGNSPDLAIMLSREIPRIKMKLVRANAVYVAINQIRENPRAQMGPKEYEPGGNAPSFYADTKLWFRRTGKAKRVEDLSKDHGVCPKDSKFFKAQGISIEENPDGTEDRYFYTHVKTVKNRVFPPLKETYFRMWAEENGGTGRGIDPVWDVIRFFEEVGMLKFNDKSDVILKGKNYTYWDLKKEILSKPDLMQEARDILDSGKGFELYFKRLAGNDIEIGKPNAETASEEGET